MAWLDDCLFSRSEQKNEQTKTPPQGELIRLRARFVIGAGANYVLAGARQDAGRGRVDWWRSGRQRLRISDHTARSLWLPVRAAASDWRPPKRLPPRVGG